MNDEYEKLTRDDWQMLCVRQGIEISKLKALIEDIKSEENRRYDALMMSHQALETENARLKRLLREQDKKEDK